MITVGVAYAYSKTPIPDVQSAVMQQASKVYFSDGKTEVGQFGQTNRVILTYSQFPAVLRDAVVAAEDKNFWHEGGISPTGILRAAYYDLTSSGGNLQGASTITQQLVRNYYDDIGTAQTASRKIKEIFVAQKLAQAKSKEWILQQYLNTVYFGGGAYGVAAAAQVYFGLDPSQPQQDHPGAGRDDRRDDPEPELLQARPQRRSGPRGPGVPLEVRAPDHGDHGHAVPAGLLGGAAEVPCRGSAGEQHLERLPRLHHAGRAERTGDHLPLLTGADQHRWPARGHHVQPEADELAVRHGPAGRQPHEALHGACHPVFGGARDLYGAADTGSAPERCSSR